MRICQCSDAGADSPPSSLPSSSVTRPSASALYVNVGRNWRGPDHRIAGLVGTMSQNNRCTLTLSLTLILTLTLTLTLALTLIVTHKDL